MKILKHVRIRGFEMGLVFRNQEFQGLLAAGSHWLVDLLGRTQVEVVSRRAPWLAHEQLDVIVQSGALEGQAVAIDLKDHERGLVWIDGRFSHILPPGLHVHWLGPREVRVELVDARQVRFEHKDLSVIARTPSARALLDLCHVDRDRVGVLFIDGRCADALAPGLHAFWKGPAEARVVEVDLRETTVDVSGQEIMTADKVTLRVNACVTYRVVDPRLAVSRADDARQALYRETQLALRAVIGARELDAFLVGKDTVGLELEQAVRARAAELGLAIASVGVRDVILPGEMKDLMNKVTEAKKAAEANLISRREETAAIRSQVNTARLLAEHPTLMRLRELEVLEKIASAGQLQVVLGEKGLADRVINAL